MRITFAKWLKERIKGHEQLLDDIFGEDKWRHWIRVDNSGQSLPSPFDYRKLKGVLNLPNNWDKWILETIITLIDDKCGSVKEYGWSECCVCGESDWGKAIVLDPFAGSGTTLLTAEKMFKRWIGVELNPKYCEMAKNRLTPYTRRMRLI